MPVSLTDYVNLIKDPMSLGLYKNLVRMSDIVKLFPVTNHGSLTVEGLRWDELPEHGFRKLNATFSESTGTTQPAEDSLAIFGGKFSEDEAFERFSESLYRDPVEQQFAMHTVAMERGIAQNVINGDTSSTPDGFNGLYARFDSGDFPSSQVISASGTTDSLKVHASAANAQQFFRKLDEACYAAGIWGPQKDNAASGAILMNKTSFLGIQYAAQLAGYTLYTRDVLGYHWFSWQGLPFVDVGKQRDKSTEIIGDTYDPGDAGNDSSRIFIVRFSEPDGDIDSPGSDGLSIVQVGGFARLGPIATLTAREWGLQWILGLTHIGDDYCAALLEDFKMAAS